MADWLSTLIASAHTALDGPSGDEARAYLAGRGVTEAEWRLHHLGCTPFDLPVAECTQAFADWMPKYFYGRLLFPFFDARGAAIGLQTRSLDKKFYQQFYAYPTELSPFLFGLPQALPTIWETGVVAVVEGVFDYFAVSKVYPGTVAILTANPSAAVKRFLRRYAMRVVALLDMDEAGRQGVDRLVRDPDRTYMVTAPSYPGHDPGDLLAAGRLVVLERLLRI